MAEIDQIGVGNLVVEYLEVARDWLKLQGEEADSWNSLKFSSDQDDRRKGDEIAEESAQRARAIRLKYQDKNLDPDIQNFWNMLGAHDPDRTITIKILNVVDSDA